MTSPLSRERRAGAGVAAALLDLALVGALAAAAIGFTVVSNPSSALGPVRVLLGALLVFVLPGYALSAALFPAAAPRSESGVSLSEEYSVVSAAERAVLSVGLSLVTTPLVVLALNFTPFGINRASVLNGVCAVVLVGVVVAAARRLRLPSHRRFGLSYSRLAGGSGSGIGGVRSVPKAYLLVAVFLVASAGLVGATLAEPGNGERYTELYLLSDNGENGTLVADNYPETLGAGGTDSLYVGITNHESRTVEYTVVTKLQRLETVDGERQVTAETELDRFSTTLADGEEFRQQREIGGNSVRGERLRLIFLLYDDEVPDVTAEENAYRKTHIWVNATAGGTQT